MDGENHNDAETSRHHERRTRPGIRVAPELAWTVASSAALRLIAVLGMHLYLYFDSAEYDRVDFSGAWRRPWALPLLYSFLPKDEAWAIVVVQALLGAVCWAVLAVAAAGWFSDRRVRIGVAATILTLSLTTGVTNWDTAKLSESLSISLTVLLLAAWLRLMRRTTWANAAAVAAISLPWLFIRQSVMPTAWALTAVVAGLVVVNARRPGRRPLAPLLFLLAASLFLNALATISYSRNQEIVDTNLTSIISMRIAPRPDRVAWFTDRGMPVPASGALDFTSLDQDPAFQSWVHERGGRVYAQFLATHPWYSLTAPLDDLFSERASYQELPPIADKARIPTASMLSPGESYGSSRNVVPQPIEATLFAPGDSGTVVFGAVALTVWGIVDAQRRRTRRRRTISGNDGADADSDGDSLRRIDDRRSVIALAVALLCAVMLWSAWHGAGNELARLAIVPALGLRLAGIFYLAVLAERWLGRRGDDPAALRAAYSRPG